MKVQLYLFLLLSLIFSTNLLAVRTTGTIDKTKTEKIVKVKKKPVKKFFKSMTQRVLENKIVKRLNKKPIKEKTSEKEFKWGLFSLIFSASGLLSLSLIVLTSSILFGLFGLILIVAGFVTGIKGVRREEKKLLSVLGIILSSIPIALSLIYLITVILHLHLLF